MLRQPSVSAHREAQLAERARTMRHALTPSEVMLRSAIRGNRLGTPFRRQVVVGEHIADFLAPRERLIIEVDGGYHRQCAAADARKDRDLARLGYRVLRLDAELVLRQLPEALRLIQEALNVARLR